MGVTSFSPPPYSSKENFSCTSFVAAIAVTDIAHSMQRAINTKPIFLFFILAGVYDIKNLKLKIRPSSDHQYNSPWNIAADFDVSMGFSAVQIRTMLDAYESDHQTGMDTALVADEIYQYTSGYPYLVSAICKILDEKLPFQASFIIRKKKLV